MAKVSFEGKVLRTERIAVLMTPLLKADLVKIAAVRRESVNTIVNNALQEYVANHKDDIQRYNDFFGEE